jgi:SIR2-like domain
VAAKVPLLIITTNYDDLIEKAFKEVPYDMIIHVCDPKLGDCVFLQHHKRSKDGRRWVDTKPRKVIPNKLDGIDLSKTTVIYKMHGTIDRRDKSNAQYVISEDDYIEFLTRMTKNTAIPSKVAEVFSTRHFLFLGYGLRDWNLRVVLNGIQGTGASNYTSWAIQYQPSDLESRFWEKRNVVVYDVDLRQFVTRLKSASAEKASTDVGRAG